MKKLTVEAYEKLKAEIQNREVPSLFHSMLFKQAYEIYRQPDTNDAQTTLFNLFNLFFRQYNTILVLANKIEHINHPGTRYLDTTSIHALIRCCHERFLALWYLATPGIFPQILSEEEAEFKFLCFLHGGLVDSAENIRFRSRLVDTSSLTPHIDQQIIYRHDTFEKIKRHPIFNELENEAKIGIEKYGAWRIAGRKILSWNGLARISPLNSSMAQYEYHTTSLYTHPGYAGLASDIQHDQNIDGLLAYLYVIAASNIKVIDKIFPESAGNFSDREIACLSEFLDIAQSWLQLPPLPEWDA